MNVLIRGPLCMASVEVHTLLRDLVIERLEPVPLASEWSVGERIDVTVRRVREVYRLSTWVGPFDEMDEGVRARVVKELPPGPDGQRLGVVYVYEPDGWWRT